MSTLWPISRNHVPGSKGISGVPWSQKGECYPLINENKPYTTIQNYPSISKCWGLVGRIFPLICGSGFQGHAWHAWSSPYVFCVPPDPFCSVPPPCRYPHVGVTLDPTSWFMGVTRFPPPRVRKTIIYSYKTEIAILLVWRENITL